MSAPEKVVVIWTPADEDTMPATISAHTPKSRDFVSGAPKWMDGERLEYVRAALCDPTQDERVRALEAENARLREALEYIRKPQYGLQGIIEDGDSDEERAAYFSGWCDRYQDRARAAIRALGQG